MEVLKKDNMIIYHQKFSIELKFIIKMWWKIRNIRKIIMLNKLKNRKKKIKRKQIHQEWKDRGEVKKTPKKPVKKTHQIAVIIRNN